MNESIDARRIKAVPPGAPQSEEKPDEPEVPKKDTILIISIAIIIILLAAVFLIPKLVHPPYTLEQLHERNFQGKLPPDKGYVYNGQFSFIYQDKLWYTLLTTADGSRRFSIPFHYGPREVEDILPQGFLNDTRLNEYDSFYITFDPNDEDLAFIGVSIGETDRAFVEAYGKGVISSCIHNDSAACINHPIINCSSTEAPVFYFASEPDTRVLFLNNCIIVTGSKEELFRATDRMLFSIMGIMQ